MTLNDEIVDSLAELAPTLEWSSNIWIGVSVEDAFATDRINKLRAVGAFIRFVSFEPLLGPITDLNLEDIHWAIVGGESGTQARNMATLLGGGAQCRQAYPVLRR